MSLENRKAAGIRYRPDVDGLRAVAVLMVFADHLDTKLSGGYVGVDVFFVISGYLIGAMILAEMREGRFSVARFYERRLKRIFPAMLAMMLGVTVLACIYLIPSETVAYTRSLLAALFSGSNFLFWHEGGYFDIPGLKPLLHTWSLGVEEQFYILFPLFLMFVRRWLPNQFRAAILWVALISFIAACITVRNHPVAAFYFAPLRAWELLLGTIVSQRYVPWPRTALTRNIASLLGLALIVAPGFLYTSDTPFPGVTALAPCLGTALIIAAGETGASLVGSVLAWRPVVFVGLISYSLYLWHWPIIVFQNGNGIFVHSDILTRKVKIVLIVVAFVVSTLSWRFVEQPFRKGPLAKNHKAIFSITGGVSLAIVLVSVALLLLRGLPQRFTPESLAIAEYQADIHVPTAGCFLTPDKSFADFSTSTCLRSTPGKPSILVAGDSHSDMLMPGLVVVYPDRDLMQASTSNCPALVTYSGRPPSENCRRLFGFLYNDYLKQAPPGVTLVLAARWREEDLPDIGATVDYVRSLAIPIVIVGPSIEFDKPEARTLAFAVRDGHLNEMPGHLLTAPRALDREMAEAARSVWHAPYVSIFDDLCTPACPIFAAKDVALDYDHNHLTQQGAVLLARAMREKKELP